LSEKENELAWTRIAGVLDQSQPRLRTQLIQVRSQCSGQVNGRRGSKASCTRTNLLIC